MLEFYLLMLFTTVTTSFRDPLLYNFCSILFYF